MRVRAGRAQQMGGRALRTGKTGEGVFQVRVRVGTVSKERRGTLRVQVRAGMVRKTVLRVLQALRVYKRAL